MDGDSSFIEFIDHSSCRNLVKPVKPNATPALHSPLTTYTLKYKQTHST